MGDRVEFRANAALVARQAHEIFDRWAGADRNGDGLSRDEVPEMPADRFEQMASGGRVTLESVKLFVERDTLNQLQQTLISQLPDDSEIPAQAQRELANLVRDMDRNHDGRVVYREFEDAQPAGADLDEVRRRFDRLAAGGEHITAAGITNVLKATNTLFHVRRVQHDGVHSVDLEVYHGRGSGQTPQRGDVRHVLASSLGVDLGENQTGPYALQHMPSPITVQDNGKAVVRSAVQRLGLDPGWLDIRYWSDYTFQLGNALSARANAYVPPRSDNILSRVLPFLSSGVPQQNP